MKKVELLNLKGEKVKDINLKEEATEAETTEE